MADEVAFCPVCGATVAGDPDTCPRCRVKLGDRLLPLGDSGFDWAPEQAVVEKRGLPPRWTALALAIILAAAAVLVGSHSHGVRPVANSTLPRPLPAPGPGPAPAPGPVKPALLAGAETGTKLALCGPGTYQGQPDTQLTVVDLDQARITSVPVDPSPLGSCRAQFAEDRLFVQTGGDRPVFVVPDNLVDGSLYLAGTGGFMLTPPSPAAAWVVNGDSVSQASVTGILSAAHRLPPGWKPVAATLDGLVLQPAIRQPAGSNGGGFELWDPATGSVLLRRPNAVLLATGSHVVVWSTSACNGPCEARVSYPNVPAEVTLTLQSGGDALSVSPDDQFLAVYGSRSGHLEVRDLSDNLGFSLDPGAAQFNGPWKVTWSSTGHWVFMASSASLVAYHVGDLSLASIALDRHLLVGASLAAS